MPDAPKSASIAGWTSLLAQLDQTQVEVLKKYKILDNAGNPVIVPYNRETQRAGGAAYPDKDVKLSADAARRLLALDPTSNHVWTDWIFYQAGGGDEARAKSQKALEAISSNVYANIRKKVTAAGKTPKDIDAEVERLWQVHQPIVKDMTFNAEEDIVIRFKGPFGFSRDWPGWNNRYKSVADATTAYFAVYKKAAEMNEIVGDTGRKLEPGEEDLGPVPLRPEDISDVGEMNSATRTVRQFWVAKHARSDVRVVQHQRDHSTVYDDDFLTVIVPLTHAAAVRYGLDAWDYSNAKVFQNELKTGNPNAWKRATDQSLVAFMTFNVPVASRIGSSKAGDQMSRRRRRLNDVAVLFNEQQIVVVDEDNNRMSEVDFLDILHGEGEVPEEDPAIERVHPVKAPRRKPDTTELAKRVEKAFRKLKLFARKFDRSKLQSDFGKINIDEVPA